jgi:hypothetical protein
VRSRKPDSRYARSSTSFDYQSQVKYKISINISINQISANAHAPLLCGTIRIISFVLKVNIIKDIIANNSCTVNDVI